MSSARARYLGRGALPLFFSLALSGCLSSPDHCVDDEGEVTDECPVCDPELLEGMCYEGPPATAGVGQCRHGTWTCDRARGVPVCEGQSLPAVEFPEAAQDEDCDGRADEGPSIACADCGPLSSISVERLTQLGAWHSVIVRLRTPADAPVGRSAQLFDIARATQAVAEAVAIGARPLRDVQPLAIYGFTAQVHVETLPALVSHPEVVGVMRDIALTPHLVESAARIGAVAARQRTSLTGRGVRVAIIDSGIDYHHPAFGACPEIGAPGCAVVAGWDFADDDPEPMDTSGHGTHLASVVAGRATGPLGPDVEPLPPGIAPHAEIVALRVEPDPVAGRTLGQVAQALGWLRGRPGLGVQVVLIGVGTPTTHRRAPCLHLDRLNEPPVVGGGPRGLIGPLVEALRDEGVVVIAASGNAGDAYAMSYPACLEPLLAVGATYDASSDGFANYDLDPQVLGEARHCADQPIRVDAIPCFSNGDPLLLDLVAPGASIRAAGLAGGALEASGTSAAAAHVAGAAALMMQDTPGRPPRGVQGALRLAAVPVNDRRPPLDGRDGEVEPGPLNGPQNGYTTYRLDLERLFSRECFDGDGDGVGGMGPDCDGPLDCQDDDPTIHPGAFERCNGRDENCDGRIDEGFELGRACEAGVGACAVEGVRVCAADGQSAECSADVPPPSPEACNGIDDDCDGLADEGLDLRTVTFFRTGEACCDYFENNGVDPNDGPRLGPYFNVAEGQEVQVRVRYASDGHVGCVDCDDCPGDGCDARCLNPDDQDEEGLHVQLVRDDGHVGWRADLPDLNGGGDGDWRSSEQRCRQRDHDFGWLDPGPGRWRVLVRHVNDPGGAHDSVKLQTSRVRIRCQ